MAILGAVLLAFTSTTTTQYTLTAATYILPGLFGYPWSDQASRDLATSYISGAVGTAPPSPLTVLHFPSQPPPADGLQPGSVIFGYSEGAFAATTYKQDLNQYSADNKGVAPEITFVLIGNQNRPNGGNMARMNLGATPTQSAGANPGEITTFDIARQYDAVADYPTNPLNLLAVANAAAGFVLVHLDYFSVNMKQAVLQGTYGDTKYYLIPTQTLPLLMPLKMIPGLGPVLADTFDPVLRVLVEAGYDRTTNPGVPTPFNYLYYPEPAALSENLQLAFLTGMDNGLEDLGMSRPFGTVKPGPYGVGGPPVTLAGGPPEMTTAAAVSEAASIQTTSPMTVGTGSTAGAAPSSIAPSSNEPTPNPMVHIATDTETPSIATDSHPGNPLSTPETAQTTRPLPASMAPTTKPDQLTVLEHTGEDLPDPKQPIPPFEGPRGKPEPDSLGEGTVAGKREDGDSSPASTSSSSSEATSDSSGGSVAGTS